MDRRASEASQSVVQEFELHQLVTNHIDLLPQEMRSQNGLHFFVWAHELRIHDAGRKAHTDGYADLLALDERGMAWLVEVKLSTSVELTRTVWRQLLRYRDGLMKMSWDAIHGYLDRFLEGEGKVRPTIPMHACSDLPGALGLWHGQIGRSLIAPKALASAIAGSLRAGQIGLCVLADAWSDDVVRGAEVLPPNMTLGHIAVQSQPGGIRIVRAWVRKESGSSAEIVTESVDARNFKRYSKMAPRKITAAEFVNELHPLVRPLWETTLAPRLHEMGWDGTTFKPASKGFTIRLRSARGMVPILHVGHSGADSGDVPRMYKHRGTAGFCVNLSAWYLKESGKYSKSEIEGLAGALYMIGWRGTGYARLAGTCVLSQDVFDAWSYMRYKPSPSVVDFLGRAEEKDAGLRFLNTISRFLTGT